jgi:hypothetical protein
LLELADAVAARWLGQWHRAAAGWLLLHKIAKVMRHGCPAPSRELIVETPGAGSLGRGLRRPFDRWVLVVGTTVDHEARTHALSDSILASADPSSRPW